MDTFLLMYRVFTTSKSVLSYLTSYYHQLEELRTGMSIKDQLESSKENEDGNSLYFIQHIFSKTFYSIANSGLP